MKNITVIVRVNHQCLLTKKICLINIKLIIMKLINRYQNLTDMTSKYDGSKFVVQRL
jgi:hypothetical protein